MLPPKSLYNSKKLKSIKEKLFIIIFGHETKAGKLFDLVLLWLIVGSVIVVMAESVPSLGNRFEKTFMYLEWVFTILFTIEYLLRVFITNKPLKYIFSFWGIIDFLAQSIENSPEFDVEPDPRTGLTPQNPKNTMTILIDGPSEAEFLHVPYKGHKYTVEDTAWNYNAFTNLYYLYQTAVTDVSTNIVPVTIAK